MIDFDSATAFGDPAFDVGTVMGLIRAVGTGGRPEEARAATESLIGAYRRQGEAVVTAGCDHL